MDDKKFNAIIISICMIGITVFILLCVYTIIKLPNLSLTSFIATEV